MKLLNQEFKSMGLEAQTRKRREGKWEGEERAMKGREGGKKEWKRREEKEREGKGREREGRGGKGRERIWGLS